MKTWVEVAFAIVLGMVQLVSAQGEKPFGENVIFRGSLQNAKNVFETTGKGTVAFMGGSITEMEGYRPMVCKILRRRFPKTKFTFIASGISSTCSTTGAFRWDRDILAKGPIDLFLVEFAVNDEVDGHFDRKTCIRGFEGIIRKAMLANPKTDIVTTFFATEGKTADYQNGKVPLAIQAHGQVAEHYGISVIQVAKEVADEIQAGKLTWKQYGGIHPKPFGNAICARMFDELFTRAGWDQAGVKSIVAHQLPSVIDPFSFYYGRFIDPRSAKIVKGWQWSEPDWKNIPGHKRSRFLGFPHFWTTTPGAEAALTFSGTCIGTYLTAGVDAGFVDVQIDNGAWKRRSLMGAYSKSLHYPFTILFADELPKGDHLMKIRFPDIPENKGKAARFMQFVVNFEK